MNRNNKASELWITIHENDGDKPKTQFYVKRANLIQGVRANDGTNSAASRAELADSDTGTIVQEGCVITTSQSLATAIAELAHQYNIAYIYVGQLDGALVAYEPDRAPWRNQTARQGAQTLLSKMSRRGKKPAATLWTVTCPECASTEVQEVPEPLQCDYCRGSNIKYRPGEREALREIGDDESLFDWWVNTRFHTGTFEIPDIDLYGGGVVAEGKFNRPVEAKLVRRFFAGSPLAAHCESLGDAGDHAAALLLLDAAWLSNAYHNRSDRAKLRSRVAAEMVHAGADTEKVPFFEGGKADALSALPVVAKRVAKRNQMIMIAGQ